MLSETSQTEKDKHCMSSHVEPKKAPLIETEDGMVVARGCRVGELGSGW